MFDFAVKNGLIVDGSRQKPFVGTVYLKDGNIAQICTDASLPAAASVDAVGLVTAPGFVDMHCHSDCSFFCDPTHEGKLRQGVTFELSGQCGVSAIPINSKNRADTLQEVGRGFGTDFDETRFTAADFAGYGEQIERTGVSINQSILIGHGTLRSHVIGYKMRQLTNQELGRMCDVLNDQFRQGALGFSLGLIYPPGSFCDTEELVELAKVVARNDGMLAVHMRNENKEIFSALDEIIEVAKRTGVKVQISHLKLMGVSQWGRSNELLHRIEQARAQGVRIHCDQYPYTASSSALTSCVPVWAMEGGVSTLMSRLQNKTEWGKISEECPQKMESRGGAGRIVISHTAEQYVEIEGMDLEEIAAGLHMSVVEAMRHILLRCGGIVNCSYHSIDRNDMLKIMARSDIAVASDGTAFALAHLSGKPHPRNTSTFPCFFKTVREEKMMSIEDAVYKVTALPATLMGLGERIGSLKPGYAGDIVVFDPYTIADKATYQEPWLSPVGIDYVWVNGELALDNGKITGNRPGRFYRK